MSNVPAAGSRWRLHIFGLLVQPVGRAAAVGSLDDAPDVEARDLAGLFGGLRCASLKYAGTVITASVTF